MPKTTSVQQERQYIVSLLESISVDIKSLIEGNNEFETAKDVSFENEPLVDSLQSKVSSIFEEIESISSKIDGLLESESANSYHKTHFDYGYHSAEDTSEVDVQNAGIILESLRHQLFVKDEQVRQLYEELQEFRRENTEATKLFAAKHLIYIVDALRNIIPLSESDDKSDFINSFHSVIQIAESELSTYFDIEPFIAEDGSAFNPKEHNAVQIEPAEEPDKVRCVKECLSQGYRSVSRDVIVKKASVIVWN